MTTADHQRPTPGSASAHKSSSRAVQLQDACAKPLSLIKRSLSLRSSINSHQNSSKPEDSAAVNSMCASGGPDHPHTSSRDSRHSRHVPTAADSAVTPPAAAAAAAAGPTERQQRHKQALGWPPLPAVQCQHTNVDPAAAAVAAPAGTAAAAAVGAAPVAEAAADGPPSPAEMGPLRCRRLAEVLLRCGKPAEAVTWADHALADSPWDVELLLLRGKCLEAAGNTAGAFSSYMSALSVNRTHVPCLMALASLYKAKGMLDEARSALEQALAACQAGGSSGGSSSSTGSSGSGTGSSGSGSRSSRGIGVAAGSSLSEADAAGTAAAAGMDPAVDAGSESNTNSEVSEGTVMADEEDGEAAGAAGEWQQSRESSAPCSTGSSNTGEQDTAAAAAEATAANMEHGSPAPSPAAAAAAGAAADGSVSTADVTAVKEALAVVLTDLGTRAKSAGRLKECEALYRQALSICPAYPSVHYNLGVLASEGRRWAEALQHYQDTLQLAPHHAQALCNSGVVYREMEQLEAAVAAYEAALAVAPNYPIVRTNLAVALTDLGTALKLKGQLQQGISMYERALALVPRHSDALYNLGVACSEAGQVERAMFCYELTTHFNPSCAEAWNNLGVLYKELDNLEKAAECYMAALNIRPNFPQSLNNLAVVLTSQGKAGEALALLQAAIAASPGYAEAHNNLGVLQRDVGAIPDALASYERALSLVPDSRNAGQNRLLALNYIHHGEDPAVCGAHAAWGEAFQAQHAQHMLPEVSPAERGPVTPGRRLKVGYVSPDLFTHSVSYFAEAPLTHHNLARVQLFVYSCVGKPDGKTVRLRQQVLAAGGTWRDVAKLSEQQLAQLVRHDEIDILVELTGHTANNRLGVCAMRAAPIQVTWIGYPNSTGLAAVDYRITDAICDPLDTKQTFTEELVRLPGCFLCYTPASDAPPVPHLPAASNGFITFGSFNNLAKITPQVLALWARILHSVPASRLVLKAKPFSCPAGRHHVMAQLQAAGVAAWRVDLLPLTAGTGEHLSVYGLMDISLDPFPYAGTTTTTESLFMGVPVITLAGSCHAHNVSCSLLAAVGLADEWVAHTSDEYVQLAVRHASNVPALQQLRQRLRPQMLASRMCNAKPFVAQLEDTYDAMWRRWVAEGGRKRPIIGLQQQPHQLQGAEQQQQQQWVSAGDDGVASAAGDALEVAAGGLASPRAVAAAAIVPVGAADHQVVAAAAATMAEPSVAGDGAATDAGQLPDCAASGSKSKVKSSSSSMNKHEDQNCGSRKGSSSGDAAGAESGSSSSSSSAHKGRKISSSCDAAATMHAGAAVADGRGL